MAELKLVRDKDGEGLLDMEQAARYLNVKVSTLYEWCMRKQISYVKLGKLNRFRRQDLDKFIEERLQGGAHDKQTSFG